MTPTLAALFPDCWTVEENGCWLWTKSITGPGYANVNIAGRLWGAHRAVYTVVNGPVPDGLELDHVCHNRDGDCTVPSECLHRRCVNPAHLEPVTRQVNLLRGHTTAAANAAKTHCSYGHPYDEVNTRHWKGHRYCIACQNRRNAAYRAAAKARRASREALSRSA